MRLIPSRKARLCKRCPSIITSGDEYWPQRRGKGICYNCYHKIKRLSVMSEKLKPKKVVIKARITMPLMFIFMAFWSIFSPVKAMNFFIKFGKDKKEFDIG